MRVALLPTGRTEWHGMSNALTRLFVGHSFYPVPTKREVESYPDRFPYDGFTSSALTARSEDDPPESAIELVARAAQEALGDRRSEAADLVVVLDDMELANANQPDRIARVFRAAVARHLAGLSRARGKTEEALRERVSFHLITPMIEAWFFGDPRALVAAGAPPEATPRLAVTDIEAFRTNDESYLAATDASCPCWASRRDKKNRPKWLGGHSRAHHPKGYLQWLCLDGGAKNCTSYDETHGGGRALSGLRWEALLGEDASRARYLRALLADLADDLGDPVTGPVAEHDAPPIPVTRRSARPRGHVLRNL